MTAPLSTAELQAALAPAVERLERVLNTGRDRRLAWVVVAADTAGDAVVTAHNFSDPALLARLLRTALAQPDAVEVPG